jgi:hypothetical protein
VVVAVAEAAAVAVVAAKAVVVEVTAVPEEDNKTDNSLKNNINY